MSTDPIDRLPVHALVIGEEVRGVAVVRVKERGKTKKGDPYLTIELGNVYGAARLRVWHQQCPLWDNIEVGDAVEIVATVQAGYNGGAAELTGAGVRALPRGHAVEREMHPISPVLIGRLYERLEHLVACLSDSGKALLSAVLAEVGEAYTVAPAAMTHHHAYLGGLFEHSLEVTELAIAIAQHSPAGETINWDAVIVGGLLHDVGKVHEYAWIGGPIRVDTHAMAMKYHTVSGQLMVERVWQRDREALEARGVDDGAVRHLQHVIASHHRLREYGSVVAPCSLESLIIHYADDCSAQLRQRLDDLAAAPADADGWVQPPGYRKAPVLSLASVTAISPRSDSVRVSPGSNVGKVDIDRVLLQVRESLPPDAAEVPDFFAGIGADADAEASEDLLVYLAYLVRCDIARWDNRRRLPFDAARRFSERLEHMVSPERRTVLDAYVAACRQKSRPTET